MTVQKPAAQPSAAPDHRISNDIKATPVASAIIADKKVNPATIKPTGTNGRILKHDVLEALIIPAKKHLKVRN